MMVHSENFMEEATWETDIDQRVMWQQVLGKKTPTFLQKFDSYTETSANRKLIIQICDICLQNLPTTFNLSDITLKVHTVITFIILTQSNTCFLQNSCISLWFLRWEHSL